MQNFFKKKVIALCGDPISFEFIRQTCSAKNNVGVGILSRLSSWNLKDTHTSSIGSWLFSSIFPGVTFLKNSFFESFRLLNLGAYLSLITDSFNRQGIQSPKIQSDGVVIDTKVRVQENSNLFNYNFVQFIIK